MPAILCVFAHPDDESFGPAGTIARYTARGIPVELLCFTRGQNGTRAPQAETAEAIGALREYELRAAARVLGVRRVHLLDYMDGALDQADADELAGHVLRHLEELRADTVIAFGPLGITRHGDHIAAHKAAVDAAGRLGRPVRLFYVALEGDMADEMELSGAETQPTHRIDTADYVEVKLMALSCHGSQEDAREFFARLLEQRPSHELFHRAMPPVKAGTTFHDLFA